MNTEARNLVKNVNHHLLQSLEVLNKIDDDNYRELVMKCRTKKQSLKRICENAERGSPFLTIFFLLEMLSEIADEPK